MRAVTKVVNGQVQVVSRHDFMPFGEEVNPPSPPTDTRLFTGKERDAETGWDYSGARYVASPIGRFTSPDPLLSSGSPNDPQSWNRYSYVHNNPLRRLDPTGLYDFMPGQLDSFKEAFRSALNELDRLAQDKSLPKETREQIAAVRRYYGSEGDNNGVKVAFGALKDAYGHEESGVGGRHYVTLDIYRIDRTLNNIGEYSTRTHVTALAAFAAHEGTHIPDDSVWFQVVGRKWDWLFDSSRWLQSMEFRAVNAQSLVWSAANERDPWGLWDPAWAPADAERLRQSKVKDYWYRNYVRKQDKK